MLIAGQLYTGSKEFVSGSSVRDEEVSDGVCSH